MAGPLRPLVSVVQWAWRQRQRFLKFGVVGVSGVAINQVAIWACNERLFTGVENASLRLNLSMAVGIVLGMTNNFHWNRKWTWKDRERTQELPVVHQYLQYAAANWAGIVVQVAITNLLSAWMPYLLANLFGIGVACVINFILNDLWTYRHVRTEGIDPETQRLERARLAVPLIISGLILGLCTYLYGLGSLHILRNGDEWVYMQITRVPAASDHWLPLQSGMEDMRNTKPPLLFWQGLLTTDWGSSWSLSALRWPSVLWTFLTAGLCGLLGWRLSDRDAFRGALAALFYLAFFSTFRYGRPYLTNPAETFWVFACFFTMLWWMPRSFDSRVVFPTVVGLLAGMALLTKSFAQLVPMGLGLAWWHLMVRGWSLGAFVRRSAPGLAWVAVLSLAVFSLWFALDPEPAAIWREFVLGENVGKMGSSGLAGWLRDFAWGGSSVWTLAGSWFLNAGLLAFPLFGVSVECWKHRRELRVEERLLWVWVAAIFLVFCLPTQRSGRYLLEAMPALAVLMALRCHHVGRNAFVLSLVAAVVVALPVGWVSVLLAREVGMDAFPWWHWVLVPAVVGFAVTAIAKPDWSAMGAAPAALGVFLSISGLLSVFDAPLGTFDAKAVDATTGRVVWVPENFRSVAELDRFLLPRAVVRGYPAAWGVPSAELRGPDDFVVVSTPMEAPAPAGAIGSRIDLTSRHTPQQIWEMATGRVQRHLFSREWLVPAASLPSR